MEGGGLPANRQRDRTHPLGMVCRGIKRQAASAGVGGGIGDGEGHPLEHHFADRQFFQPHVGAVPDAAEKAFVAEAGKIQLIRTQGQLLSEEYVPDGIEVKAYVPKEIWGKV